MLERRNCATDPGNGGFQVGANVCLVGLYNAAVLTAERSLFFLVNTQYGDAIEEWTAAREGVGGALWSMMQASGDAVGQVQAARWVLEEAVDMTSITEAQKVCVAHGGFLAGVERFDGKCFGVSPAEANAMDPQQRLVLEVAYEALHGAGARKASLLGDDTGVFLGIERPDWALLQALAPPAATQSAYAATGDTTSVAGGRLSFVLGLQGPCVSVDTACSSALVALHGAWAAVRLGECAGACASAVGLKLSPHPTLAAATATSSPTRPCSRSSQPCGGRSRALARDQRR